jgi:phytoene synthase
VSSNSQNREPSSLERYLEAAQRSSSEVIDSYSTSFGWASKFLGKAEQQPVRNIYALVRIADEIVDGAADEANDNPAKLLDELEAETYRAIDSGFSSNLVVHAFAHTAREAGIKRDIIEPFFHSMRMDLTEREHDQKSFDTYVYGSAEVVGLMCLKVFMVGRDYSKEERVTLIAGARALGAAFQKVNFLRDLSADFKKLGRSYFPDVNVANFDAVTQLRLIEDIQADLDTSAKTLPLLPAGSRKAVAAAQMFFEALNERIRNTPAEVLIETRISVPNTEKLVILSKALLGIVPK